MKTNTEDINVMRLVKLVDQCINRDFFDSKNSAQLIQSISDIALSDLKMVEKFFMHMTQQPLSETIIDRIFEFSAVICRYSERKDEFNKKHRDIFYAVQFHFDLYLRFQLPFNLWQDLATQSWIYLVDFINGKYKDLKEFEDKTQAHWETMTVKLDEYQDHPKYGEKIRARTTGYV